MAEQTLKEKTAKGLFWGGISNGVQQLLGLLIGIVLLKNLSPGDYGMVGMLAIFTGIASTLLDSGFTAALTNRPEFKKEDYNSVFWFNLIVGINIYVLLFFCAPLIADFFHQPELVLLSRIIFLTILINSIAVSHNAVLFRKLMVKERAIADIVGTALSGIIGIILAIKGYGYWALVWQSFIYIFISNLIRCYYSPWHPDFALSFKPIKEMFGFGFKLLISSILTQIQNNIFSVLLGRFYTKIDVGYYSQGTKWTTMGMQFISGPIYGIAQPVLSQAVNDKDRQVMIFRKIVRFIAFVSFPLLFGLAFIARDFVTIINPQFLPSVPILQMYCISSAFYPFQVLYSTVAITQGCAGIFFWSTLIYAIIQIVVSFLVLSYGIYWLAFTIVLTSLLYYLSWHFLTIKFLHIRLIDIIKDIAPYIIITLSIFGIVFLLLKRISDLYYSITLKILFSVVLYVIVMKILKSNIFYEVFAFIRKEVFGIK